MRRLGDTLTAVISLHDGPVEVRPSKPADVAALAGVLELVGIEPDDARTRARRLVEHPPTLEVDGLLGLVVESDHVVVGSIQARAPAKAFPPGVCEIGVTLLPHMRGLGIGRRAVRLFTDHLLDQGWSRVQASTALDNRAMRRVLEASSYVFEGVLRSYAPATGETRADHAMYAVTAADSRSTADPGR